MPSSMILSFENGILYIHHNLGAQKHQKLAEHPVLRIVYATYIVVNNQPL